jgi:hypothetical protein
VLGYYMELAGLHRPVRGLFYNPEEMNSMMDPARDLWVFATHEDWWNIDRGEISDFLTAYTLMPQDLPDLWGVEIRRSRRPEQLVEDRELKPIEVDGGETTAFDLALDGSGSPYLGGGWFTSHPWAAPFYRQKLMATRADLLIPLAVPRSVEIRARLRLRGEPVSRPFEVNLVFGGETVESWHVGSSWATYVVALPAEALDAGLNVVTFTASETLRVPAPEKGEAGQAPSLEVDWMDLTLGGPTVEEAEPSLALGGAL